MICSPDHKSYLQIWKGIQDYGSNCSTYFMSAKRVLLPVAGKFFLPFKLKRKDKLILLLLFFVSILLIQWKLGNIGVIVLLFLAGFYIAWIDQNRFLNVCIFISTYLFCVVCDNLLSGMGNSKSSSFRGCWRLWGTYSICDALSPDPCSNLSWTFQITALFDWEDPPDPSTAAYRTNIDQPCFLSANLPF